MKDEEESFALPIVKARMDAEKDLVKYFAQINERLEQMNDKVDSLWQMIRQVPAETTQYKVADISLAEKGKLKIEWAEKHMPALMRIRKDFENTKPFTGITIAACLHVTKEAAVLAKTLKAGGAVVALCGSNPLSTQDDVASALVKGGINVFAWRGLNSDEYYWCLNKVLDLKPNITLDDGADLISTVHSKRQELFSTIYAGQEETTTGVIRLKAMAKDKALKYPVIAVNDTPTKNLFDNYYGTGQSSLDGIMRATNILFAGKNVVVCGYGQCGKGVALKAKGLGANVTVTETNPLRALQAVMDGFLVKPLAEASKTGDVFITVTGDKNVIRSEHIKEMKDGAILANSGHFNVEISLSDLEKMAESKRTIKENVQEYVLENGRKIYFLAEGRLVNLAAAEGHPSEVMDMSFSNQALTCEWIVKNYKNLRPEVYNVPKEIDDKVAQLKLEAMGITIDKLTEEQEKYLSSWEEGT